LVFKSLDSLSVSGQTGKDSRIVLPSRHTDWQSLRIAEVFAFGAEPPNSFERRREESKKKARQGFAGRMWPPPLSGSLKAILSSRLFFSSFFETRSSSYHLDTSLFYI
jgi:hypothetical protein